MSWYPENNQGLKGTIIGCSFSGFCWRYSTINFINVDLPEPQEPYTAITYPSAIVMSQILSAKYWAKVAYPSRSVSAVIKVSSVVMSSTFGDAIKSFFTFTYIYKDHGRTIIRLA